MASQTPLLAGEGDNEPILSGQPDDARREESALSRLITASTPPEFLTDETVPSTPKLPHKKASFVTMLAGTFLLLQWGYTWGAYFGKSWMDVHIQIYMEWQQKYLPFMGNHTDLVVQGMSVFTISDNLKDDKDYVSLTGIWICSLILPCIFMIASPIWIFSDFNDPPRRRSYWLGQSWNRLCLELTIRWSWLVVFILMTLNVAMTGIELKWEGTDAQFQNALRGSYLSYILGCSCAILTVVVLRIPHLEHLKLLSYPDQEPKLIGPRTIVAPIPEPPPPPARFAPPASAFSLPWLSADNDQENDEAQPLLERTVAATAAATSKPLWKELIVFQFGLFSFLLWFPPIVLAQFRVLYGGMMLELFKSTAYNVYVWEMPLIVWRTAVRASTPLVLLIPTLSLMGLFVVILPLLAYVVAIVTWWGGGTGKWRDLLTLLHPTLCGMPFALAVVVTVPSFIDIGENIDEQVCGGIEQMVFNQCLISGGVVLWGAYFLLAQAVCLEAFVILILCWTAPPLPPANTV